MSRTAIDFFDLRFRLDRRELLIVCGSGSCEHLVQWSREHAPGTVLVVLDGVEEPFLIQRHELSETLRRLECPKPPIVSEVPRSSAAEHEGH